MSLGTWSGSKGAFQSGKKVEVARDLAWRIRGGGGGGFVATLAHNFHRSSAGMDWRVALAKQIHWNLSLTNCVVTEEF